MTTIEIVLIAWNILVTIGFIALYRRKSVINETNHEHTTVTKNLWITWGDDNDLDGQLIRAIAENQDLYAHIYNHVVEDYYFMERVASNLRSLQVGR